MNFSCYLPANILFGYGAVEKLGGECASWGHRALVVTGKTSAKKSGLLDRALDLLKKSGLESVVFSEAEPNPTTTVVYRGVECLRKTDCDILVALGGGSIIDCAKGIAFAAKNPGNLTDYIFGRKVPGEALPLVAVPTTCGTGSEANGFSVLTDPDTGDKKSLRCVSIVPRRAIIDPELMTTMPRGILAGVGFDALCHCMEAWLSAIGAPISDLYALEGIRLVHESLLPLYRGEGGKAEWEKLSWASALGGMAIGIAGVTAPHGLEHPASGLRNLTHGRGLASLTPPVIDRSAAAAPAKYAAISRLLGGRDEGDCAGVVRKLLADLDLAIGLGDQGIRREDVDWMAENALKVSAAGIANHPVKFGLEEIREIYRSAL
jgi:alcohol dehydrogenase class IV